MIENTNYFDGLELLMPDKSSTKINLLSRDAELTQLHETYNLTGFKGICMYGFRQVGKTALLKAFCTDTLSFYYQVSSSDADKIYSSLYTAVADFIQQNFPQALTDLQKVTESKDILNLFRILFALSRKHKLVIIIDEFPYLTEAYPDICIGLQALIDIVRHQSIYDLLFILCGSNIGIMREIISAHAPLYERLTPVEINELRFSQCKPWLSQYSPEEAFTVYSITGGIPGHLEVAAHYSTTADYLTGAFLTARNARYTIAPQWLHSGGISYFSAVRLLKVMLDGETERNKIIQKSQLPAETAEQLLNELCYSHIIAEKRPLYSNKLSKCSRYYLADKFMAFWYTFIDELIPSSQRAYNIPVEAILNNKFKTYMGHCFEDLCKEYLLSITKDAISCGYWEDKITYTDSSGIHSSREELDILIQTKEHLLLAECKYTAEPVSPSVLKTLIFRGDFIDSNLSKKYYIFSNSGFTASVQEAAEITQGTYLITFQDIINTLWHS